MSSNITRRYLMEAGSGAVAVGILSSMTSRTKSQSSNELRVSVGGGDWGKANIKAYVKPFEAETGIKVTPISDDLTQAQIELMAVTNNVTVDVVGPGQGMAVSLATKGLLEKIDYSIFKKDDLDGIAEIAKKPWGVGALFYASVTVYNTEKYPAGKPRPNTWAEFWDVKGFPGVRTMMSGSYGSEGPWEEALLADGVTPDEIYPMDVERIFASLERIKPHVRKWWTSGSEIQQILRDKATDLTHSYDGRALLAINERAPLEINRNQSKLNWSYWAIPKGSPNLQNAQKFIEFASRADRQSAFVKLFPQGPSNSNAFKDIPDALARKLCTYPEYVEQSVAMNIDWYGEVGADGLTNTDRLIRCWNEWIFL